MEHAVKTSKLNTVTCLIVPCSIFHSSALCLVRKS